MSDERVHPSNNKASFLGQSGGVRKNDTEASFGEQAYARQTLKNPPNEKGPVVVVGGVVVSFLGRK